MSIKSIPLKTWEVKATLDNRKSSLRRVVKMNRPSIYKAACAAGRWSETFGGEIPDEVAEWYAREVAKPPYRPGDILWVRETWGEKPAEIGGGYIYKADIKQSNIYKWNPSIHMPKAAARLFLRVKSVRVERLQQIRHSGVINEGACEAYEIFEYMFPMFAKLWDSALPKNKNKFKCAEGAWDANPWVFVVEFERCEKPENFLNGGRP